MDFLLILFVFIFPLASIIISGYCFFQLIPLKRMGSKLAALSRLSGKDDLYER